MDNLKYIKEFLSTATATEGSLLIPKKIYDTLIEETDKNLIPRSEVAIYFGPGDIPGSSVDVNLVTPNTMDIRIVGEGAEMPLDNAEYTSFNLKPVKYGVCIRITRELIEDAQWNLLEHNIKLAGKRFAENENSLIISDALDNAGNTVSGGAAVTIANIASAMYNLDQNDYASTTYAIGNDVLNDLRNIDTFVEADKFGTREMLDKGFVGKIYGMNVLRVSTNAGMTTTTSYIYDKNHAFVMAEKRPISIERFELPSFDMSAAAITQRIKVRHLRANAICKITSS
jgi:HK97 family phage major capsid protein